MIVTPATTHRSLYVGATRGCHDNQLFVVTDSLDPDAPRAILEQVLANDRVDLPAVAQRRHLAKQEPPNARRDVERRVAAARRAVEDAAERAGPQLAALTAANRKLEQVERDVRVARQRFDDIPRWRRRTSARSLQLVEERLAEATSHADAAHEHAVPYITDLDAAQHELRAVEHQASRSRLQERLETLGHDTPQRSVDRSIGIEL